VVVRHGDGAITLSISSEGLVISDDKPKHTPESVAAKVVKALLKVPPKGARKDIAVKQEKATTHRPTKPKQTGP
jgi:hypothetical protein